MKASFVVVVIALMLAGCGSAPPKNKVTRNTTVPVVRSMSGTERPPSPGATNTFKGISVEVVGIPYEYKDIRGNHALDYLMEAEYQLMSTGQASSFVNFTMNKFVFNFLENGGLVLSTVYSYDQTPAGSGAFYPARSGARHDWKLEPAYHSHAGTNCSLDFYNDIAIAQAKLNEMRRDPSLRRVYDILLSVAEDMDYNYPAIGYSNVRFVTLANGREPLKGVCDDYSRLLINRLVAANIEGVSTIQKVSGQNHAWVTLVYQGKTLYLDATWFDENVIRNGVVEHTPHKDPRNMTFDREVFTNHRQHHIPENARNLGY